MKKMTKPKKPYNPMMVIHKNCNYSNVSDILDTLKEHGVKPEDAIIEAYDEWGSSSVQLNFEKLKYSELEMKEMEGNYQKKLKEYDKWYSDNKDEIEKLKDTRKEARKAKALAINQRKIDHIVNQMNKIKKI